MNRFIRRHDRAFKHWIRTVLHQAGYDIVKLGSENKITLLGIVVGLSATADHPIRIVQVGANDGGDEMREIIHAVGARALLIEPNVEIVPLLKKNYQGRDVLIESIAIDSEIGSRDLFVIHGPSRERYESLLGLSATRVASFDRAHVQKHLELLLGKSSIDDIGKIEVATAPLSHVAKGRGFFGADVLQIDAEGYDYCVLQTCELQEWRPTVIKLEISNLNVQDLEHCRVFLQRLGYVTYDVFPDMISVLPNTKTVPQSHS